MTTDIDAITKLCRDVFNKFLLNPSPEEKRESLIQDVKSLTAQFYPNADILVEESPRDKNVFDVTIVPHIKFITFDIIIG